MKISSALFAILRLAAVVVLFFSSAVVSMADVRFASGSSALKIPFKLWNNHIYLRPGVNSSEPAWFLLDTGASNIVSSRQAKALGLNLSPIGQTGGIGENSVDVWAAENITFTLPAVSGARTKI